MATKIKGFYRSLKYIPQIFVVKEREMEIGNPTDVKHVAHIGWDGPSGSAGPSWMSEFKSAPNFSTSIGSLNNGIRDTNSKPVTTTSCSTQEPTDGVAHVPKKHKRKKPKSAYPKSSSKQPRQSRAERPEGTHSEREAAPVAQF